MNAESQRETLNYASQDANAFAVQSAIVLEEIPADILPIPVGWRMLIEPIRVEERTKGGLYLPDQAKQAKEYLRYIGYVRAQGALCYCHPKFGGMVLHTSSPATAETSGGAFLRLASTARWMRMFRAPLRFAARVADSIASRKRLTFSPTPTGDGSNPWCKPGDWVVFNAHEGQEVQIRGEDGKPIKLRLINDDSVLAVAPNPEALLIYV